MIVVSVFISNWMEYDRGDSFPFKLNETWSWWQFSFQIECNMIVVIVFLSILGRNEILYHFCIVAWAISQIYSNENVSNALNFVWYTYISWYIYIKQNIYLIYFVRYTLQYKPIRMKKCKWSASLCLTYIYICSIYSAIYLSRIYIYIYMRNISLELDTSCDNVNAGWQL